MSVSEVIKAFFKMILNALLSVESFFFQLWLKRFSQGERANILYHKSELGNFFFFKKNGWPGKISPGGFNPTSAGDTFLTIIIEGDPTMGGGDPLARKFDEQINALSGAAARNKLSIPRPPRRTPADHPLKAIETNRVSVSEDDVVVFEIRPLFPREHDPRD
ncbi:MAG: hypothetical protein PHE24_05535 [Patescibacteria group bacterium]|nr:hypothetical protein [Patescibacteria group bacterium]